jgi:hypothetical protein
MAEDKNIVDEEFIVDDNVVVDEVIKRGRGRPKKPEEEKKSNRDWRKTNKDKIKAYNVNYYSKIKKSRDDVSRIPELENENILHMNTIANLNNEIQELKNILKKHGISENMDAPVIDNPWNFNLKNIQKK